MCSVHKIGWPAPSPPLRYTCDIEPAETRLPRHPDLAAVAAAALGFVLAAGPAADDGGFFSDTWGWVAVLTLGSATVLLAVRPRLELRALDAAYLGGLVLLTGWAAVSALWAPVLTSSLNDVARLLAYVGAVTLCLLVVRRRTVPHLLGGLLAGVTAVSAYALLTRLLPGRLSEFEGLSTYRLSVPIDYWNGLGAYAAMGVLLAFGLSARGGSRVARGFAAAAPVVLVPTLYFTFSRGAWIALAAGLLVAVVAGPRRLQYLWTLVVLAPWPVLALLAASKAEALTFRGSSLDDATNAGRRLLLVIIVLALFAGLVGAALAEAERHFELERSVRVAFAALLAAGALAGLGLAWDRYDAPWSLADRGWSQFWTESGGRGTSDLGASVFTLSSNGRADLWRVAWDGFESAPVVGLGAGSFSHTWYLRRDTGLTPAEDAHGLYVETMSELGVVGFGLLLLALAAPLMAAAQARRFPLLPAALGAYVVFLAAAAVDWHWELAGVALIALLAACGLVIAARPGADPRRLSLPGRLLATAVGASLAAVALVGLLGAVPLGATRNSGADLARVTPQAERATRWAPWSSEPWRLLGEAQLAAGDGAAARASYRRAVREEPEVWRLWYELALFSTGRERQAALERALALNPLDRRLLEIPDAP